MKKRVATMVLTGVLALTSLVGAGTYAYFSDSASSTANAFQAGTIKLASTRQDIPITGPMFYTNDSTTNGVRGTGLWKPSKRESRAMFITNEGTLPGRLRNIKADFTNSASLPTNVKNAFLADMKIGVFMTRVLANGSTNVQVLIDALEDAQIQLDIERATGGPLDGKADSVIIARMESLYDQALANRGLPNSNVKYVVWETNLGAFADSDGLNRPGDVNFWRQPTLQPGESIAFVYQARLNDTGQSQNILQNQIFNFDFTHTFTQLNPVEIPDAE